MDVARYLLDQGAHINHRTPRDGIMALAAPCTMDQNIDMVALLLQRGADATSDATLTLNDGRIPWSVAATEGRHELVRVFLDHGGSDIDHRNHEGETALYLACGWAHAEAARLLGRTQP